MELTGVYKISILIIIILIISLNSGCSGDDSCPYIVKGYVKNAIDSMPLVNVKVSIISYDLGHQNKGTGSSSFVTDSSGNFSFEIMLTPQRAYSCPEANEVEYRFRYEKSGFLTVDTVHAKGNITDGGIEQRNKTILVIPTIYLEPL